MPLYWTNPANKQSIDKRLLKLSCGCIVLRLGKKRGFRSICFKHAYNNQGKMR